MFVVPAGGIHNLPLCRVALRRSGGGGSISAGVGTGGTSMVEGGDEAWVEKYCPAQGELHTA